MCNLAGYTGNRLAAPILIEMLRREQYYDGGMSTGIATIHEGKLYCAKVLGDLDTLIDTTDALNFPGTIGIVHSRPSATYQTHAHPFTDCLNKVAIVLNGTLRDVDTDDYYIKSCGIMQDFFDRGKPSKTQIPYNGNLQKLSNGMTYHDSEPYAFMAADNMGKGMCLCEAAADAMSALPGDLVTLTISVDEPDTIAIARVTRPMSVAVCDGETYVASTPDAFPTDILPRAMVSAPVTCVTAARPGTCEITEHKIKNVATQAITADIYAKAYYRIVSVLKGKKYDPQSMYGLPFFTEWRDLWKEPYTECEFNNGKGCLKPYAELSYAVLYALEKEGRLHRIVEEEPKAGGIKLYKFWID